MTKRAILSEKLEDNKAAAEWGIRQAELIKKIIQDVNNTNHDHHLLFNQIGEKVGFINESIIRGAFLSTWCEQYTEEVQCFIDKIQDILPRVDERK